MKKILSFLAISVLLSNSKTNLVSCSSNNTPTPVELNTKDYTLNNYENSFDDKGNGQLAFSSS